MRALLRFHYHWCPNVRYVIKLACLPVRHPNAPVGRGYPRQVTLMQSVAGRELEKIGHQSTHEVRMRRFRITSAIHVGLHDSARLIHVVTIQTGAMILVLTDDVKMTDRSVVTFAATGYPRCRGSIPSAVEIGFLRTQTHYNRRPTGMTLG